MTTASATTLQSLATELYDAEVDVKPIAPLSDRGVTLSIDDAYAIQQLNTDRRLAGGARLAGLKIGLTSAAMQAQLGVDQPDSGVLFEEMMVSDGVAVSIAGLVAPRVEAEIAVTLSRELAGPGVTEADVAAAIATVVPALEVIDSRIADWRIALVDTVADNASSALAVVGPASSAIEGRDLKDESVELLVDGEVVASGTGAALLGDPLTALAWLANRLGSLGSSIPAGILVLAGSVHASVPFEVGHEYTARYSRVGSVSVTVAP